MQLNTSQENISDQINVDFIILLEFTCVHNKNNRKNRIFISMNLSDN